MGKVKKGCGYILLAIVCILIVITVVIPALIGTLTSIGPILIAIGIGAVIFWLIGD